MSTTLHSQLVEALGRQIVSGDLPRGTIFRSDDLEAEFAMSRSVVREALRSLQLLGMTESVKSLGVRVQDKTHWNPYAQEIIRWRLIEGDLGAQLRSITELRSAVEPVAARLCAQNATAEISTRLMELSSLMRIAGRNGNLMEFERLDIEFHALVLAGSGNEMFAHLDIPIGEVLRGRTELGLMPSHPHEEALQWHVDVADSIQAGRDQDAYDAMNKIVVRTVDEINEIWVDTPRNLPDLANVQKRLTEFK